MQPIPCARIFALLKAGNNIAARIAMIAITTSSSIKVNPRRSLFGAVGHLRAARVSIIKRFEDLSQHHQFTCALKRRQPNSASRGKRGELRTSNIELKTSYFEVLRSKLDVR